MHAYGITDRGLIRENNEDFYAMDDDLGIYIVADGLGGAEFGEVASRLAVEALMKYFRAADRTKSSDAGKLIDGAVENAHQVVRSGSRGSDMGTTIVLALEQSPFFWIANVGDSRGYLLRDGQLELITKDHTNVAGNYGAAQQSQRALYQALGMSLSEGCFKTRIEVRKQDLILLCSDSLWDMVSDEDIKSILITAKGIEPACQMLVETAKQAGGYDNITLIAIKIE
ncbi:MAG: protein phosphatase 2C domain-containing protein [Candidatus Omnitrophota bacterium]